MSAPAAPTLPPSPASSPSGKRTPAFWAGSLIVALGLGLLLGGAASSDITTLSDALTTPAVETSALPTQG